MKEFGKPVIEFITFNDGDVITTSDCPGYVCGMFGDVCSSHCYENCDHSCTLCETDSPWE